MKYVGIAYNHREEIFYHFIENNFEIIKEKADMYFNEGCWVEIYRCNEENRVCIYRKEKK